MFFNFILALFSKLNFFTGLLNGKNSFSKPLSKEDERKYLRLYKSGDKTARDVLVKHNMRLVAHVVKKYNGSAETDDLLSVGSIGLIKAIETYEEGHGTSLSTYTARCIENEILMLIRANKKHRGNLSLSDPVGLDKDGNELTIMDLLCEKEDCVYDQVERSFIKDKLNAKIKSLLTEREYTVLSMRFALNGGVPLPQREVAKSLQISRSYISRIEKRAIEKLRHKLEPSDFT